MIITKPEKIKERVMCKIHMFTLSVILIVYVNNCVNYIYRTEIQTKKLCCFKQETPESTGVLYKQNKKVIHVIF